MSSPCPAPAPAIAPATAKILIHPGVNTPAAVRQLELLTGRTVVIRTNFPMLERRQ